MSPAVARLSSSASPTTGTNKTTPSSRKGTAHLKDGGAGLDNDSKSLEQESDSGEDEEDTEESSEEDFTTLHSLIPLIDDLEECVLEGEEYHIDGLLSENAKKTIVARADEVLEVELDDSSPTDALAHGTLLQLSSIRVPLFPNLASLWIEPQAPDLTYLNLLLSPSLEYVSIRDVKKSSQRIISSFFKALPSSLKEVTLVGTLPRSATLERLCSFRSVERLTLQYTHPKLDPALIANLGQLPGLLELEVLLGPRRYKPRSSDGPGLRPCGHLSLLPCPSPCQPSFGSPTSTQGRASPAPRANHSILPLQDTAKPSSFLALNHLVFQGTVSETLEILSSISSQSFVFLDTRLDLVKFDSDDTTAPIPSPGSSHTRSKKPSPRRVPSPDAAVKLQIEAWAHHVESFLLSKQNMTDFKTTLLGSKTLYPFPMSIFSTATNSRRLEQFHIESGWALQHDDPRLDAVFNSPPPSGTSLTTLALPYSRPTPLAITFLPTLAKRFPKLEELQCRIGCLDDLPPFNFTGPPVVPSPNATPALVQLTVLNSVQKKMNREETYAVAVYLHAHFPKITITSTPQLKEVAIKDDEVDPEEFWTEVNHLVQLCRAGVRNDEKRRGVDEVKAEDVNDTEAVQDGDVVMEVEEVGPLTGEAPTN